MKKVKLSWLLVLGLFALPVAYYTYVYAAYSYQRFTVSGNQIYELYSDGSVSQTGPTRRGKSYTATSVTLPTTTTGSNFSQWVPVYNASSTAITAGTVLIASNTGTGYVIHSPATIDLTNVVGIAAESIAATTQGWMVPRGGGYAVVLTTGTVAIGDVLVTSGTVAGRLGSDTTPTSGAQVATAMSAGAAAGDSVLAIMW